MAGFFRLYVVGGLGGFMGADGVNPIEFMILAGHSSRQWLEPHYFNASPREIPAAWARLREEARPIFAGMNIWRADLTPIEAR